MFLALIYPTTGCSRGLNAIIRFANLGKDDLAKAARAGALYMVIRRDESDDLLRYDPRYSDHGRIQKYHRKWWSFGGFKPAEDLHCLITIHGVSRKIKLPDGYLFALVPRNARVVTREKTYPGSGNSAASNPPEVKISSSSNVAKAIVAIFQTVYGSLTLYRARGDQLDRYGFAAFGLTVTPYVVMSITNLMGCLMTPSYPMAYLVHSAVLDELSEKHNDGHPFFDGTVGTLVETDTVPREIQRTVSGTSESNPSPEGFSYPRLTQAWLDVVGLSLNLTISSGIPLSIIGILSRFHKGKSTVAQKVWTMCWLNMA